MWTPDFRTPELALAAKGRGSVRSWEDYFWPGTTVLANKLGITDANKLDAAEHVLTTAAANDIAAGVVEIPRTFDADHLKALHKHLFQDVYEWAGQYREVNMSKDGVAFAARVDIDTYLSHMASITAEVPWNDIDAPDLAEQAARVYSTLNHAHPFREGNGRAGKLFVSQLVETTRYDFDYNAIDPLVWNQRSALSAPDLGDHVPHHELLTPVFAHILIDRPPPAPPAVDPDIELARKAARFARRDHPTNARSATTRPTAGQGPQSTSYRPSAHYRRDPGRDNPSSRDPGRD
ncbi:Fic/DOC family protein [Williamsia muralis]|uniref:Fic/DOC family protein n=1 Tax=Williamsia marianensis TaxID=85044 RepID=UPI0037FAA73D